MGAETTTGGGGGATSGGLPSADLRRLRRAEILLEVYRQTAVLESLDDILGRIVEIAAEKTRAERGSLFLLDEETGELYSRIAQGNVHREIRVDRDKGVAGAVFTSGRGVLVPDVAKDERFDPSVDQRTGFTTRNILCAPLFTMKDEVIGVVQMLNRRDGEFPEDDLQLLEDMGRQASVAIQSSQFIERMAHTRAQELKFLEIVADITSEIEIKTLLRKVMAEATKMLDAERSTIFLNDEKAGELWSLVGAGLDESEIRFPNHQGIAGMVFTSGESVDIPHAYADLRFNPEVDRKTGFFTRSILCVPIINKSGKTIGVIQVLNKRGGPFTHEDESRLRAFSAQVSIALDNATLFNDVQDMKNYNQSILESLSTGVVTLDEKGRILTCNTAGQRIMKVRSTEVLHRPGRDFFVGPNAWVNDIVDRVVASEEAEMLVDRDLEFRGEAVSANLTVLPLVSVEDKPLGSMLMIEDISSEKRMKSTMARYMNPSIVDKLLEDGGEMLGGKSSLATILFADIRGFTTLTEDLGPIGTVNLLNEYFTIMTECIQRKGGILDKFMGDAIMAAFGVPLRNPEDEDNAVQAAIEMHRNLVEWNRMRHEEGKPAVRIGIGLSTDEVVSGNIGSPKRMDYTLIGDGVNLASRLEGACKQYGTLLLISEGTYQQLKGSYRHREVDRVLVKGKKAPVTIYEILDHYTEETFPRMEDVLVRFSQGLEYYRRRQYAEARALFEEARGIHPGDQLTALYLDRCAALLEDPPPDDWDGVWRMTEK